MISMIFIFICVMAVTTMLFGIWIVTTIARIFWRLLSGGPQPVSYDQPGRICPNAGCQALNPMQARFCRKCGSQLQDITARRGQAGWATHRPPSGRIRMPV